MRLRSAGSRRRFILISWSDARRFNTIGPSTVLSARRRKASINFICARIVRTKRSKTCAGQRSPKCGSGGATGTGFYFPRLLEETVGAKFTIVLGYQGGGPIDLAVEKGEIHCRAMTIESFFAREPFHTWRKNNFVKSLVQSGRKRDARLPDTPTIYELMDQYKTSDQSRRIATVILAGGVFGRPMVGPAGIAPDRLKILRSAFGSALKDPELKTEAEKRNYELEPVAGEDMERLAKEVMSQPPAVIERMKKVLGN
jgi:tripartite-type tricarboxylate transporter receptor subunit TctC